jgi:pimeloyl-ACP methyl ester carboxylesterase
MTTKRTALVSAGVAAGVVAAGALGRAVVVRRRQEHLDDTLWDLPPDDLGMVTSFDGTQLAVRAAGRSKAPALLFVHGFSLDMTTWHEQWIDLSVDFRCILMDQRGHGRSEAPAHGDYSLRSMGRDVAAVIQAVSPDAPVVLIGHSMGSMSIMAMAEQRPDLFAQRVAGVALVGTASADLLRGAMGSVAELLRPRLGTFITAARRMDRLRKAVLASPADVRGAVVRLTQFGPDAQHHVVEHVVQLAERASSGVWTDGLAELMEVDLRYALPRVKVPALVIVGEHDRVTPPEAAVELAGALPDGRLVVLEGAGHMAMLERPIELDRELRRFAQHAFARAVPPSRRRARKTEKPAKEAG